MAKTPKRPTIALIDGDILLYKFALPNTKQIDWGDGVVSTDLRPERAYRDFDKFVQWIARRVKAKDYLICFSGEDNFRYSILPTYKHNRSGKEKPELHKLLRAYAEENHPSMAWHRCEADDLMGILSTQNPGRYIICTIDKDLQQIPGWAFNWNKHTIKEISLQEADLYFFTQTLTGDQTDGYSGCPQIGPKKAAAILADTDGTYEGMWSAVVGAFEAKGLSEEDALPQAGVARMCRVEDYDFKKEVPIPWHPATRKK